MLVGRGLRHGSVALLLAMAVAWSIAVVATTKHVIGVRAELAGIAQEIAHHNAHAGGDALSGRRYLARRLAHLRRPLHVYSSAIRTISQGDSVIVEVRIAAVVGFALGGHPKVRISVTRSAPVEALSGLP